jgi:hypothetical protein
MLDRRVAFDHIPGESSAANVSEQRSGAVELEDP